jgi:hypothetical protein
VVDEIAVGEPFHHGRHGSGADAELLGERAGMGLPVLLGEPVDAFQRFAL